MKKNVLISLLFIILISMVYSCDNTNKQKQKNELTQEQKNDIKENIHYNNIAELKNLIEHTNQSNQEIFLGLNMGMSKKEFFNKILESKKKGINIKNKRNIVINTFLGDITLDKCYLLKTDISLDGHMGTGEYLFDGTFYEDKLVELTIFPFEKWENGEPYETWIESKIFKNYNKRINDNLKKSLDSFGLSYGYIWRNENNNFAYKDHDSCGYIDFKYLLIKLLNQERKSLEKQKKQNSIKF